MSVIKCLASMSLAAIILPALYAEAHCPGNVASLRLRFVNRHQIVLAVSINHSGPYNFLLDTGMQVTTVDPFLAAVLHLEPRGAAVVAGVGFLQSASYAQLDLHEPESDLNERTQFAFAETLPEFSDSGGLIRIEKIHNRERRLSTS
jgi:hypothetical protein